MITRTRAIVLHLVNYSETSVIATLYTEASGRQSYIINGIRSSRSKQKAGILQPLFLLEIEAYHKSGREVQRLKEFASAHIYRNIPFDMVKSSVVFFLSELLFKVLRNEEPDAGLFSFLFDSLLFYDEVQQGAANFHLWFIVNLLSFLGLQPQNNYSETFRWFDMKNGKFLVTRPLHPETPDPEYSRLLSGLFSLRPETMHLLEINGQQRSRLVEYLVEYYSIHIERIGKMNSLAILSELYR